MFVFWGVYFGGYVDVYFGYWVVLGVFVWVCGCYGVCWLFGEVGGCCVGGWCGGVEGGEDLVDWCCFEFVYLLLFWKYLVFIGVLVFEFCYFYFLLEGLVFFVGCCCI